MLPQQELAKIYGVSNARFTNLAKHRWENFPPAERHGDKTHWYDGPKAIDAMIAYVAQTGAKRRAAAARAAEIVSGAQPEVATERQALSPPAEENEIPPLTPADIDKLASAETRVFRLQQEKGQFIRIETARAFIRSLFTTVQRQVSSLPLEIDPNGELPPMQRARLEHAAREAMLRIHNSVFEIVGDAAA